MRRKAITIRVSQELLDKLRIVAEVESRSISNMIERSAYQTVRLFENMHGDTKAYYEKYVAKVDEMGPDELLRVTEPQSDVIPPSD